MEQGREQQAGSGGGWGSPPPTRPRLCPAPAKKKRNSREENRENENENEKKKKERSWVVNSYMSKADLHIHTSYSRDAFPEVEAVLAYAASQTDLRVIAITDHDAIEGALAARRLASAYNIEVVVGEEVSTAEGHLLALFIEEWLPPGQPAAETIAAVHAQGGVCLAAHPYGWLVDSLGWHGMHQRSSGAQPEWPLDGVEAFNASLWLPSNNTRATAEGTKLNLPLCGGSDSHHLATIGLGYTLFPGTTANDLRTAIRHNRTCAGGTSWGRKHTADFLSLHLRRKISSLKGSLRTHSPAWLKLER